MISNNSRYYGTVFASMVDSYNGSLGIRKLLDNKLGFYILNDKLPILLKYSTKRTNPWSFSFDMEGLLQVESLFNKYEQCLIIFVCGIDGIISLNYSEFTQIIIMETNSSKRIGISIKLKKMYSVLGSDGILKRKVSQKSLNEHLEKYLYKEASV
jgi:hypothetical protein